MIISFLRRLTTSWPAANKALKWCRPMSWRSQTSDWVPIKALMTSCEASQLKLMLPRWRRSLWDDGTLAVLTNVEFIFHFTSHIDYHKIRLSWCSYHQLGLVRLFTGGEGVPRHVQGLLLYLQRMGKPVIQLNLPHPSHERYRGSVWRMAEIRPAESG